MPRISDKLPIKNELLDKRVKLTSEQKQEIWLRWREHIYRSEHNIRGEHLSQRKLAKEYGVSRRLIIFAIYPERLEENKKRRTERGGSNIYYDRKKHNESMQKHREYKKYLHQEGFI